MRKNRPNYGASGSGLSGCGCWLLLLAFNLTLGGISFQYALQSIIGRDVAWYWDVIMGLFLAEFTVPITVICLFLNHVVGVQVPYHPM